ESFARLLPNDRALLPPLCICRMKNTQKAIISRMGAHMYRKAVQALPDSFSACTTTLFATILLPRPSYWLGARVRNLSPVLVVATISWPEMVTFSILPASSCCTNSLNGWTVSRVWNDIEKFQTSTPATTSTIQNSRLLSVEFKPSLLGAWLSRLPRERWSAPP